jgi:hypothetical protein
MIPFQDHFDSILCLNLDDRPDRWASACSEALRLGITKLQRISATPHREGHRGAAITHTSVWKRIAGGEFGNVVLVLEDDFLMVDAESLVRAGYAPTSDEMRIFSSLQGDLSQRFDLVYREIPPDWDMIFLGGGYQKKPFGLVAPHVVRTAGMLGMHAYVLNKRSAAALDWDFQCLYPTNDWPLAIDCTILPVLAKGMRFYVTSPRFFVQRPSPSSILPSEPVPKWFATSYVDAAHEKMVGR